MRNVLMGLLLFLGACGLNGNYRDQSFEIRAVSQLDAGRYAGLWYEIARFPNSFEKDCFGVTAEYAAKPNGDLAVRNTCRKGGVDGPERVVEGTGRFVDAGKLKVRFSDIIRIEGDYWVLYVVPDYSIAVVGEPAGDFGWILARTPELTRAQLDVPLAVLRNNGYDTARLEYPAQRRVE